MRRLGYLLPVFLLAPSISAQTGYGLANLTSDQGAAAAAANNPWLGAQLAYKFGGTEAFSDNFLVTAKFLYDPLAENKDTKGDEHGWHIPIMGNLGSLTANAAPDGATADQIAQQAQLLISSAQGLNVGMHPYRVLKQTDVFRLTAHGMAGWKLSSLKTPTHEAVQFNEGRFAVGMEIALGRINEEGRLPITLSVAPALTVVNPDDYERVFGSRKATLASIEITGVLPVGSGLGMLFNQILSGSRRSSFNVGLVFLAAPE